MGALRICGYPTENEFPRRRRLVLLRRTRWIRSWGDPGNLLLHLLAWSYHVKWEVDVVTLGELKPCEQILSLHNAMIVVTVWGTEQYLASAFLPEGAALIML